MGPPEPLKGHLRPSGATRKPLSPDPDPRPNNAEKGTHPVPDEPEEKPRDGPPTSPSLERYLSNAATHEMRALRFSTADPPLVTSEPGSAHKSPSAPNNCPAVASQAPVSNFGEPMEAEPSISLSPSPPACPSSEEDLEKNHDYMGLGAVLKKIKKPAAAHGRTNRIVRRRLESRGTKKC